MKFNFDSHLYPYPSKRNVVYSQRGMVGTGNPYAAQAGLQVMKDGGNAIDAAIAAAMTLTVTEPTSNGLGSDAFAIIWYEGKLYGINGSGPSPRGISPEALRDRGFTKMPEQGVIPINVPGAPGMWAELHRKMGRLPFQETAQPAVDLAKNGYVLQPETANGWGDAFQKYTGLRSALPELQGWFDTFTFQGKAPLAGQLVKLPHHARTLEGIAATGARSFYEGDTAQKIAAYLASHRGYLTAADLKSYAPVWVEPIKTAFNGYEVFEMPPNGHGISVLMALNTLTALDFQGGDSASAVHQMIEAVKLAMTDAARHVTDPAHMQTTAELLLGEAFARERAALIHETALFPEPSDPIKGGTVYLCAADEDGNMISYIQSNYMGFGSGVVIPDTGIALNNRGANFSLEADHVNCLSGGKRSYHTIIPGFLFKDGLPYGPFGIMGGFMQPQAHVQVLASLILDQLNPQAALDKPRWLWTGGKTIYAEATMDPQLIAELKQMGHEIQVSSDTPLFGRGEIILRDDDGIYCGACEGRTDGYVAMW